MRQPDEIAERIQEIRKEIADIERDFSDVGIHERRIVDNSIAMLKGEIRALEWVLSSIE